MSAHRRSEGGVFSEAATPEFEAYQQRVLANARRRSLRDCRIADAGSFREAPTRT